MEENNVYTPKHGKMSEKTFLKQMALSITVMVLCLAAMAVTAYAYFSHTESLFFSTMRSAYFDASVVGEGKTSSYFSFPASGEPREVEFTIKKIEQSTANAGFCKINIFTNSGAVQSFYTAPIGTYIVGGEQVTDNELVIKIYISGTEPVDINFIPEWGSYSGIDTVSDNGTITPIYATE